MKFKKLLLVFALLFALFIPVVSAATYPDVSTITDGDYIVAKYADNRASPHILLVPTSSYDVCYIDYITSGSNSGYTSISFYDSSGNKIYFDRYLQNGTEWKFSNQNNELFGWSEYDNHENNKVIVASTVSIEDRISGGFFLPTWEGVPEMMKQGAKKVQQVILQVIIVAFSVLSLVLLSPWLRRVLRSFASFLRRL